MTDEMDEVGGSATAVAMPAGDQRASRQSSQGPDSATLDSLEKIAVDEDGPSVVEGDPFNPHKVLNYFDRLAGIVAGELVWPVTVEIDPCNRCNHRCAWCVSTLSHTGEQLEFERFQVLVEELARLGVRSVVLKGGGEPGIHPAIHRMLHAAAEAGLAIGLITNGSMAQPGTLQAVLDTCEWVRISLDAARPETHRLIHGTADFGRILENVEYLAAHARRTLVGLSFVAEARNHREVGPFCSLARSLDVDYVSIRCVFDPFSPLPAVIRREMRRQAEAARRLEDERFRVLLGDFTDRYLNADPNEPFPFRRCLGPNLVGIIGADGEVYACCFLRGNKGFSFGNLGEESFERIWSGPRRQAVMARIHAGQCGHVCVGGTTSNRYNTYNEILNYLALGRKRHEEFI